MRFKITPTIAAKAVPDKVALPPNGKTAPPSPMTNIAEAIIRFLCLLKSTWASIKIRSPLLAITPYKRILIPPNTQVGIELITAAILPQKESTIAMTAAPHVTYTEPIFVKPMTPVFSP